MEAWGAARARNVAKAVERERALRKELEPARRRELEREETLEEMLAGIERMRAMKRLTKKLAERRAERQRMRWWGYWAAEIWSTESWEPRLVTPPDPRAEMGADWLAEKLAEVLEERVGVNPRLWTSEQVVAWVQALMMIVWLLGGQQEAHLVTYDEILANSKLVGITYYIKRNHRLPLAHRLWPHRQQCWWLIQIIAPIYRLPSELLQHILLNIINNASDSPLVLMQVSKLWYNTVTGIWASLKLGTMTPKDSVTDKMKRNQWLLDVVVDTEIDRGHFTLSDDAYQAIFAAMEATSRWRSLVLETFPAQADLPEDLVNCGLQRCTDAVMNRLRTFKVKVPCEMSPLLNHLDRKSVV